MHINHLSLNITTEDVNNPQYSKLRKRAAEEFLEKELKTTTAKIISSKMSHTSPILWIEVQDSDRAEAIIRQSAYYKRDAKQSCTPPRIISNNQKNRKELQRKEKTRPKPKISSKTRSRRS